MIYIDTRDQLSLKHGVMEFLNVTEEELELVFETIDSVDEDPYDWVKKYLEDYGIDSPLEYIQMFHLTRRLNGTDLRTNNNLERLLLCKTPLSDFFKRYDVTFKKHNGHMELYYKGALQTLDFMVVLQGCKPVICSYDYSSYFICDSDSMACCGDHRSGRCCMFYIAVYNWLDIELEFDITKLSCRMFG